MNKKKIVENWIKNHGACNIDIKKREIELFDGGLFSIETKKVMRHRIKGIKKSSKNGFREVIFTKKKFPCEEHSAIFWTEELDETISYLKSMKRMLNKIGIDTGKSVRWQKKLIKDIRKMKKKK